MGFTIQNYTLMGIQFQNIYVSIKGRFFVQNSSYMYNVMMPKKYQINADYFFHLQKGSPVVQSSSIVIDCDDLPQDFYGAIYEAIKLQLQQNSDTPLCYINE